VDVEIIGTCSRHVEMKNVFKRSVGKLEWKREIGRRLYFSVVYFGILLPVS
jgi:hypothetical protein